MLECATGRPTEACQWQRIRQRGRPARTPPAQRLEESREPSRTITRITHRLRRFLVGRVPSERQVARRRAVDCFDLRRRSRCPAYVSGFDWQYDQPLAPRSVRRQRPLLREHRLRALCARPAAATQRIYRPQEVVMPTFDRHRRAAAGKEL